MTEEVENISPVYFSKAPAASGRGFACLVKINISIDIE
jgi:hypothetical protein